MQILEILYYISGIGIFILGLFGLQQIKLFKQDIKTKNERAAMEKTIEYLSWFANEFIPQVNDYNGVMNRNNINRTVAIKYSFIFDKEFEPKNSTLLEIRTRLENGSQAMLNQLEFFSAAMMTGLANEEKAFNPAGRLYCDFIEDNYVILCFCRSSKGNNHLYTNTIDLYKLWNDRFIKRDLENQKADVMEKLSNIPDKTIKAIGS